MTPVQGLAPRYRRIRTLGQGSFATVVAAEDSLLGRHVAVKLLREELVADPKARRRFDREVRTAALLGTHPHVVTMHDAGEWQDRPYLVLELLSGSVAQRLRDRAPVEDALALRWLAQAAEALDFAHAHGVVHRDVKPGNLLLDERGDVRLADFGVVGTETRGTALTLEGEVVGTPGYLAPEVARGGAATPASDLYSLALVARELLGDRPALERALAENPSERPPSAAAFVSALAGSEAPTRITTLPDTAVARMQVRPAAPLARTRELRRHRAVRVARAATLIAVVAAVSAAAGAYATVRVSATTHAAAPPREPTRLELCAMSPLDHDANIVVAGAAASRFCRTQAHVLRLDGDSWTYRTGRELFAPDHGTHALGVVCRLRRRGLQATVYDTGSRSIGKDLCGWYTSGGWRGASIT